jgi:hypothetical protein
MLSGILYKGYYQQRSQDSSTKDVTMKKDLRIQSFLKYIEWLDITGNT